RGRSRLRFSGTAARQRSAAPGEHCRLSARNPIRETAEKFRTEGLEIIADLEDSIARRLVDGLGVPVTAAGLAASSIFAATLVAIARVSTGMRADRDAHEDLALQVAQIVAGACSDVGRPTVVSDHPHGRSNDE